MSKLKIVGIVAGGIIVLAAIILTAMSVISRNQMGKSVSLPYYEDGAMPMEMGIESSVPSGAGRLSMNSKELAQTEESYSPSVEPTGAVDRRIIKNGDLNIRVDRVDDAQKKITDIAKNNGGQIFSSNIYRSGKNIKSGNMTVKVPVANFEKTLDEIKKVASLVLRESTSGQDVTEEYQDLQTQIKNKQAEEQAYIKIMDQAQKISDVLEVQQQLSRVRGEIEQLQGRIKYMESQTDMSTIDVSLTEDQDITAVDSWRPFQVAKDAVNSLIKMVQNFVDFLIVFVITFIPTAILYLLLIFVVYLIGRKIYRRFRKNKEITPGM